MEKLYTSKTFLENGRMHTSHPTPMDPPLAISYKNHQNSLAYFCHLAPLILIFFTKRQSQKRGGRGHGTRPMPPLNTFHTAFHQFRDMIATGKESTIVFSTIDKLVASFKN